MADPLDDFLTQWAGPATTPERASAARLRNGQSVSRQETRAASLSESVKAMTDAATKKRQDLVARLRAQRLEAGAAAAAVEAAQAAEPAPAKPKRVRAAKKV